MSNTRVYWLHTLSPTHAGIGRGIGYIDLPIDRDGVTGWPILRGSGFKGVWADHHRATAEARGRDSGLRAAFGVAGNDGNSNSGALIPTDARLVCLPARSFRGTFAWATSSLCLGMLRRMLTLSGFSGVPEVPEAPDDDAALATSESALIEADRIFLEDLDFRAQDCEATSSWAKFLAERVFADDAVWAGHFRKRFTVLPDSAFDFLCETGTEVHTRVRIDDDSGTVADGALWTEESLPAETILAGLIQCDRVFGSNGEDITPQNLLNRFAEGELIVQMGGKATVGRGRVRCVFGKEAKG